MAGILIIGGVVDHYLHVHVHVGHIGLSLRKQSELQFYICDQICENRPLRANFGNRITIYSREALPSPYIIAQANSRSRILFPSYACLNASTQKLEHGRKGSFHWQEAVLPMITVNYVPSGRLHDLYKIS